MNTDQIVFVGDVVLFVPQPGERVLCVPLDDLATLRRCTPAEKHRAIDVVIRSGLGVCRQQIQLLKIPCAYAIKSVK